jgi:hypothetical protein
MESTVLNAMRNRVEIERWDETAEIAMMKPSGRTPKALVAFLVE